MIVRKIDAIPSIGLYFHLFEDFMIRNEKIYIKDIDIMEYEIKVDIITPYILEFGDNIIVSKNTPVELLNILKKHFDVIEVNTVSNLLGNLFIIGKDYILYSYARKQDIELLEKVTGLKSIRIKSRFLIGSISKLYKDKLLVSQELSDEVINKIAEYSGYNVGIGSVNFGSPYLRYGIEINKNYLFVGKNTTGHEIVNIQNFFS